MRVPGQKFFVPANSLIAGMARSYRCPPSPSLPPSVKLQPFPNRTTEQPWPNT
jgi:hypothetical protein